MKHVTPEVFFIAKSQVDEKEIDKWLDSLDAGEFTLPKDATNAEKLTMLAGKRCYRSFCPGNNPNVTHTRTDMAAFIDNILKSGHGSVLEHSTYTFAIENVSRVFTAELNRHRAGFSVSEGSQRYIRFEDIPFWMPESLKDNKKDPDDIRRKKNETCTIFDTAFHQMQNNYNALCEIWDIDNEKDFHVKKKVTSMMRRIIGMGVATGGVWTGNIRAIRHVCTLRCSEAAEQEIALVFSKILQRIMLEEKNLFGDFTEGSDGFMTPKYKKV